MVKQKTLFVCKSCAYESPQWLGQCPQCGEWNTFVEEAPITGIKSGSFVNSSKNAKTQPIKVLPLSDVVTKIPRRLSTNISEFDRVLGGGFVPGQVVLLAGEPGIGKSTILTEIGKKLKEEKVLYVCGEENVEQVKIRALRMGYEGKNLLVLSETNVTRIIQSITGNPSIRLVIIDSVQTMYSDELLGIAGSVTQVRGCTQFITNVAKSIGVPVVLVGHVTKEGVVSGPKIMEHIVDTVLYLEGDSQHLYRILRTTKNRFGPVSEVGIFEMEESGLIEISDPSKLFLEQRLDKATGSCVTVVMEGFRPILFEIQALTTHTAFGYPRRTASGFNVNRLQVLIAILEKRAGLNLSSHDVYVSVAGGFKINEYASDLAVCLAITSSLKDKPVKEKTLVFGECGLNGEIRRVTHQDKRMKEAKKLGYTNIVNADKARTLLEAIKLGL